LFFVSNEPKNLSGKSLKKYVRVRGNQCITYF
jgi:hypothetical protein